MSWVKDLLSLNLNAKQKRMIHAGTNPFAYSRTRVYAPIKTRKKRIRANGKRRSRKNRFIANVKG